jgi:hypothetical protein
VVVANHYLLAVVPIVVVQVLEVAPTEVDWVLKVASIEVDWVLVVVPIEVAEDMIAVDIQGWFLIVGDIQYEAVADLAWVADYKLVVLEMVVGVALVDCSRYYFLSTNTNAKEIAEVLLL